MSRRARRARYYTKVSRHTQKNMPQMMNRVRRSDDTVDHIVPVSYGFKRGIPPRLIGGIDNLEWMPLRSNCHKAASLTPKAKQLLEAWGYDQAD